MVGLLFFFRFSSRELDGPGPMRPNNSLKIIYLFFCVSTNHIFVHICELA